MVENIRGEVMNSANRNIKTESTTDILCPTCGKNSGQMLKVVDTIEHVQHLECMNCGYQQHRAVPASQQRVISRPLPAPVPKPTPAPAASPKVKVKVKAKKQPKK